MFNLSDWAYLISPKTPSAINILSLFTAGWYSNKCPTKSLTFICWANSFKLRASWADVEIGFSGSEASIYVYNEGKEDYTEVFAQLTKKDGSFLFFSKEIGNGDMVYYAYNSTSHTLGYIDNIMRFLMSCNVIKLAKLTPNQKLGCITALGKTLNQI